MSDLDGWFLRIYPRNTKRVVPRTRQALEAKINAMAEELKESDQKDGAHSKTKLGRSKFALSKEQANATHIGGGMPPDNASLASPNNAPTKGASSKPARSETWTLDPSDPAQANIANAMKAAARAAAAADTARKIVSGKKNALKMTAISTAEKSGLLFSPDVPRTSSVPEDDASSLAAVAAVVVEEKSKGKTATARKIDELVATMRAHSSSAAVQQWASLLLYDFVWDEQGRARLADAGGIDLLVHAMADHVANPSVQQSVCSALATLAISDDVRSRLLAADGIPRVFAVLRAHESDPAVVAPALRVLLSLSWNPDIRRKVITAGGAAEAVRMMTAHPADRGVQEWGARLLGCFAVDADERGVVGAVGGVERLLASLAPLDLGGPLAGRHAAAWALVAAGLHERGNQTRILMAPGEQLRLLAEALSPRASRVQ